MKIKQVFRLFIINIFFQWKITFKNERWWKRSVNFPPESDLSLTCVSNVFQKSSQQTADWKHEPEIFVIFAKLTATIFGEKVVNLFVAKVIHPRVISVIVLFVHNCFIIAIARQLYYYNKLLLLLLLLFVLLRSIAEIWNDWPMKRFFHVSSIIFVNSVPSISLQDVEWLTDVEGLKDCKNTSSVTSSLTTWLWTEEWLSLLGKVEIRQVLSL